MSEIKMKFKTEPRNHQLQEFNLRKDERLWAWLWEQGTGKTKLALDNMAYCYFEKLIDGALILAPNGVHENWILDEIPKHFVDEIPYKSLTWKNKHKNTKRFKKQFQEILEFEGMVFFAMNYEAWITQAGFEFGSKFLKARKVFAVADESGVVKNSASKVSKACLKIAPESEFVRILNGTVIEDGPFDAFGLIRFLDANFWSRFNLDNQFKFERKFATFEQKTITRFNQRTRKYVRQQFNIIKELQGKKQYKNLDQLRGMLSEISSRVLKKDVLDLPPKLFMKRYFDMSSNQRKAYDHLTENLSMMVGEDLISAELAITRELKFQQVINGYVATDDGDMVDIPGPNPRLDLLESLVKEKKTAFIVWCRFRHDVVKVSAMLKNNNITYGQYYGDTGDEDRLKCRQDFQAGRIQGFIATEAASTGLTLHKAEDEYFYSNSYKLKVRLQMEDRAHRDGLTHCVKIWDLIANDSIDGKIIKALIEKREVADYINMDYQSEWI